MSIVQHYGRWLLVLSLSFNVSATAPFQSSSHASATQNSTEEPALRALAESFYNTWAAKDLDGFLRLWSAKSPELEARQKSSADLFANSARIEVSGLLFRQFRIDAEKANLRVEVNVAVIDAQLNKEKEGYGKLRRTLECVKESGNWKVMREISTFDELAESVVAAKTDQERSAILDGLDGKGEMAATLNAAGQLYRIKGKYEQALSSFQTARDLSEAGDNKAELIKSLQKIGEIYQLLGKYN